VDRQEAADKLFQQLLQAGYPCRPLHGGMDQFDRDATVSDSSSRIPACLRSSPIGLISVHRYRTSSRTW
jgi:hypothetical protein